MEKLLLEKSFGDKELLESVVREDMVHTMAGAQQ